jgi:hypothetical protein
MGGRSRLADYDIAPLLAKQQVLCDESGGYTHRLSPPPAESAAAGARSLGSSRRQLRHGGARWRAQGARRIEPI